jgi:hypothetical protein
MRYWFKKSYWVLWFLLGTGLAFSAPLSPSLQIPVPDHDFGEVEEGAILSHEYQVKNSGPGILEIKEVQPG